MSDLPERFTCTLVDWDYVYRLCRDVCDDVKAAGYEPDAVVALARGGWFAGRCACDFLGLNDLVSLKVEHYVGTGQRAGEPTVKYPLERETVEGKDLLVVDDIADTGRTFQHAEAHIRERNPGTVRTAGMQLLPGSDAELDFVGERLEEFAWIVYPWNFLEDMVELCSGVMRKAEDGPYTAAEVRRLLEAYHDIDPVTLQVVQPDRLDEVFDEMRRQGIAERVGGEETRYRLTE
jgi:hypothetical protein